MTKKMNTYMDIYNALKDGKKFDKSSFESRMAQALRAMRDYFRAESEREASLNGSQTALRSMAVFDGYLDNGDFGRRRFGILPELDDMMSPDALELVPRKKKTGRVSLGA